MMLSLVIIAVSLFALVKSADWLVDGASSLAKRFGVSTLVIGLTVVAFGTSAPELSVNISSALSGVTDIAVGNVIGSNIANILLILGIVAWMKGVKLQRSTIWREVPFMFLSSIIVTVLAADMVLEGAPLGVLSIIDGLALLGFFVIFLFYSYGISKNGAETEGVTIYSWPRTVLMIIVGFIGLVLSGKFLVDASTDVALALGVTERLIGLTIVAIGTSLPELVTSVVAARKGKPDLAIGNVVGSNIFNVFFILGTTALIAPLPISQPALWNMVFAAGCSLLVFIALFIGKRNQIDRWQGALMVLAYVAYITTLVIID